MPKKSDIYLDYASATPLHPEVIKVMQPYFFDKFYNPSALYSKSLQVSKDIQRARAKIAEIIGAKTPEVIFTAGGSEANNLAIKGIMSQYPDGNLVISSIEHESVIQPSKRYKYRQVQVKKDGNLDLGDLEKKIDEHTVLVSIMYANNEIGTIQPMRKIALIIDKIRTQRTKTNNKTPLYFHTDACQAGNYLDLHAKNLGASMMTLNAGKIYGPKQSGALFVNSGIKLEPLIDGGGQERGMRSGTEQVANIIGFAEALELAQKNRSKEQKRLSGLQRYFIEQLKVKIPNVQINGSLKNRLSNNVHITLPGQDNERLMMLLDSEGIMCATGSACSASNDEPSHVLKALGLSDEEARASLRFTMGKGTDKSGLDFTIKNLMRFLV